MDRKIFSEPRLSKAEKSQQEREKVLNSLGQEFGICWDAWQQEDEDVKGLPEAVRYGGKTGLLSFNKEAFFECAKKINPVYLGHIKEMIKQGVENIPKAVSDPKLNKYKVRSPEEIRQSEQRYFSGLAKDFITRLEFFSRLDAPEELEIGTIKTPQEFIKKIRKKGDAIREDAMYMLNHEYFIDRLNKEPEKINIFEVTVNDLFQDNKEHTFEEVVRRAKELSIDICPPEVGPYYRLQNINNIPWNEMLCVAMEPIPNNLGANSLFAFAGGQGIQPVLIGADENPNLPGHGLIFCLRSPATKVNTRKTA